MKSQIPYMTKATKLPEEERDNSLISSKKVSLNPLKKLDSLLRE